MSTKEEVNHPHRYNAGHIECIDAIEAALTQEEYRGFIKGTVMRYMWREKHKGGNHDLEKAKWYTPRLLSRPNLVVDTLQPQLNKAYAEGRRFAEDKRAARDMAIAEAVKRACLEKTDGSWTSDAASGAAIKVHLRMRDEVDLAAIIAKVKP
jgi:hypothetical protein